MSDHRRHAALPPVDDRIELVTERFTPDPFADIAGEWATLQWLRDNLVWDSELNMAIAPEEPRSHAAHDRFRVFAAHATMADATTLEPRLKFDQIPTAQRARNKNVYGTGLYIANRPEAALTVESQYAGKNLVAYLSETIERSRVVDERRSSAAHEIGHLIGMVGTEMLLPKIIGHEKTARKYAEQANQKWEEQDAQLVLLNEAPRRRAEKIPHETLWAYRQIPPQYALLRIPMQRIGKFNYPAEEARHHNPVTMYGKLFWEAAIRNAKDMKDIGAPYSFTSKG
jgi:hypothetical protein